MDRRASSEGPSRAGAFLLDSGMGTRLLGEASIDPSLPICCRNLLGAARVLSLHRDDADAGADALVTNTFGADRPSLERSGCSGRLESINALGCELAREAAGPDRRVLGSIGPISGSDPAGAYREQGELLQRYGVDALLLETQDFAPALVALGALTGVVHVPIFVALWRWPPEARDAARRLEDGGAGVVGTNCGAGLDDVLEATRRIAGAVSIPLLAKPSVGLPGATPAPPETFGSRVSELVELGVRWLGGCCGTTPAHVAAMRREMDRGFRKTGDEERT